MSDKIRVGILGVGRAGDGMHGREIGLYPDKLEITAVCDIDAERATKVGEKYKCRSFSDPDTFFKAGGFDLVAVCTYSKTHMKYTRQALEAGYSAIIEKPIAITYEEAKELLVLDKKYPGKLFCRQNRRFESAFQHVRELIASGIIGKVHTIKLMRNSFSRRNDWQMLQCNGGGQLNNWGPHLIDHALQFLDYKVQSVWGELKRTAAMGDADDSIKLLMRNFDGLTIDVEIFGGAALPSNAYEVYGSRGAFMIDNTESDVRMRYVDPSYELKPYPITEGHPNGFNFADTRSLPWIRQTIMVKPSNGWTMDRFYLAVYEAMKGIAPFPVKAEEAVEVTRISAEIHKQNPGF